MTPCFNGNAMRFKFVEWKKPSENYLEDRSRSSLKGYKFHAAYKVKCDKIKIKNCHNSYNPPSGKIKKIQDKNKKNAYPGRIHHPINLCLHRMADLSKICLF